MISHPEISHPETENNSTSIRTLLTTGTVISKTQRCIRPHLGSAFFSSLVSKVDMEVINTNKDENEAQWKLIRREYEHT